MRSLYLFVAVMILGTYALIASAEPSMNGYTGLLMAPTADVLGENDYNLAVTSNETFNWEDRAFMGNLGLQGDIEAGVYWWQHQGHRRRCSETLLNLKHQFVHARPGGAGLALGVSDITGEMDTAVYVVASKDMGPLIGGADWRLHGGIGGGWIDDFFFGAEARFGRSLTVMAEHFNNDISVGARMRLWRNFAVDAGYINTKDWAINISYNRPLQSAAQLQPRITEGGAASAAVPSAVPLKPVKSVEESATQQTILASTEAKELKEERVSVLSESVGSEAGSSELAAAQLAVAPEVAVKMPSSEVKEAKTQSVDADKPTEDIALGGLYPDTPITKAGHIFVPVRAVADWLGFRTSARFTAQGMEVTVLAGVDSAQFYIGSGSVLVNGQAVELPAPPYLLQSKVTMVPVEFFELLGVPVQIDTVGGVVLLERHDAVGRLAFGK